ncbi:U3 small nucleolar RNA-associated protein MPP10 [Pseudocercospora fuligena]|uniref:U3 small nucleolar ribonucleoprotein protein MPP10 n=1 Tax=Pseudocercospora fuligena TaxID=685502 RepID=A0A8H6RAA0_9PEZI|nr:U3 small nucleolar RNA-associated protein MPP10 [Pseudocercospora fuligena]
MAATSITFLPALEKAPHDFLQPSLPLYTDAVAYLKHILDPLAKDVSEEQQQRLKASRKKRKRGEGGDEEVLRLKQIHTDGFGVDQVWEQARRVIEAAREEAEQSYELLKVQADSAQPRQNGKAVRFEDDEDEEDLGEEGVDYEVEGIDDGEEEYHTSEDEDEDEAEFDLDNVEDMHDDFDDMEEDEDEEAGADDEPAELVKDKFGLNDGFFSIDDFNRQSEFLEQQDTRGEDDGAASDEEEIDWDADPGVQAAAGAADQADGAESEDDEEDGPTFGDPDAESEDEDEEVEGGAMDGLGDMGNTNDIMYKDFFAPPAQKKRKNKKGRPNPHNFPDAASSKKEPEEDDEDIERAMDKVKFDLFEDESEAEEEEDEEQLDPADPRSRRSAHERRKAQIAEEIRKLEAANVAKRDWQLSGEARAADRPTNALLEEDLDFERAGKPVPVITAEVSESIEELIKRRILAYDFQDLIRRRPDDLATGSGTRRGKLDFELDDSKSKKGLAEEYEEEYSKRTDPNYVDVKDEKLEKEQKEIERLWKEVSAQLDSLSSWNFRPKQAAPQMDIRVDAPAITIEDARPSAGGEVAGASQLAPQEVYRAGEAASGKEEVAGKSGLPSAREEMSREERKRRRRREKERIRKSNGNAEAQPANESRAAKAKKDRENIVGDLKRGNVKVIGKKGKVTDVEGKEARNASGGQGAARFKM